MEASISGLDVLKFAFRFSIAGLGEKLLGSVKTDSLAPIDVKAEMSKMKGLNVTQLRQRLYDTGLTIRHWDFFLQPGKMSPAMQKEGTVYAASLKKLASAIQDRIYQLTTINTPKNSIAYKDSYKRS